MIYPEDVNKRVNNANKAESQDLVKFTVAMGIIVYIASLIATVTLFRSKLGLPAWISIVLHSAVCILVMVFVFRFIIFKEDEKRLDFLASMQDSFSRFFKFRKDFTEEVSVDTTKINLFQFNNGTSVFCIKLKYGSNDKRKAINTRDMFTEIFKELSSSSFEFRTITETENYEDSKEYTDFLNVINDIKYKSLSGTMMQIFDGVLNIAHTESNIDCTYIYVRSLSNYLSFDIENLIKRLINIMSSQSNSLRSIEFLNQKGFNLFTRNFYGLEALDLSMMKSIYVSDEVSMSYMDLIKLVKVVSSDDRIYSDKDLISSYLKTEAKEVSKD